MPILDTLRFYDQAIVDLVKTSVSGTYTGITDSTGEVIDLDDRVVFASPERPFGSGGSPDAFSQLLSSGDPSDILAAMILAETVNDRNRIVSTLSTPIIAVTRLSMDYALNRNNTNIVRKVFPWDSNNDFTIRANYPRPWDIPYQIDIHCRYRQHANRCIAWYLKKPDPVLHIKVNFCWPWFERSIGLIFSRINDTSLLETGERERWIRHSIPVTLEGWAFDAYDSDADIPFYCSDPNAFTVKYRNAKSIKTGYCLLLEDGTEVPIGSSIVNDTTIQQIFL